MASEIISKDRFRAPVELGIAEQVIAGLAQRVAGTTADTPAGYEIIRLGLAECRTLRRQAKESHADLKKSALEFGRACDAELRRVVALITKVEEPLRFEKERVDEEKARVLREKEEAKRKEREAAERIERERIEAERRAENDRIRKEQAAERERLEAERKQLAEARQEQDRLNKIEAELIAAERREIEKAKAEIEARRQDEEAAKRKAAEELAAKERSAAEAEEKRTAAAAAKRLAEERRPDGEKLLVFFNQIAGVTPPEMATDWGKSFFSEFSKRIREVLEWAELEVKKND